MSVRSMTGRGTGVAVGGLARVEVELSSVNRKQLDVALGMPRWLASYESPIQGLVRSRISRGRVTGEIRVVWNAEAGAASARLDAAAAGAQIAALRDAARQLGLPDDLSASDILALPEVWVPERNAADMEALWALVREALQGAIDDLQRMREKEGEALRADMAGRLDTLRAVAGEIAALAPQAVAGYRENISRRLSEFIPEESWLGDERLLREVALFADRCDITEELTRLESHTNQAFDCLEEGGVVGRRLDFVVQEMGREINTIGSKANHGGIARHVITFKAELERIREQLQNME